MNGETGKVPDLPQTVLALRVWRYDRSRLILRSLNAPARHAAWVATALADPAGGWPYNEPLTARCSRKSHEDPVPGKDCTCGIYAAIDLDVIASYLTREAPVLGIVELGGRVIPAEQAYRAAAARVAALLLIDEVFTEPHGVLRKIATAYRVPAVVPHSADPEDYRDWVTGQPSLAAEAEEFLRRQERGEAE